MQRCARKSKLAENQDGREAKRSEGNQGGIDDEDGDHDERRRRRCRRKDRRRENAAIVPCSRHSRNRTVRRRSQIDTTGKSTRSVFSENEISAGIRRRREKLLQRQREWIVLLNRIAERRNMARGHALAISLPVCCRHFYIFENWGDSHLISPPDGISAPARLLSHNGEICRKPFWIHLVTRGRNSRRIS